MTVGLGVCCVTYGAGGLNMVNPVACAYAEESPLVVLSGGPGRAEKRAGLHVHHEVKTFESQLNVYREVTEYSAILDDPAHRGHAHQHGRWKSPRRPSVPSISRFRGTW